MKHLELKEFNNLLNEFKVCTQLQYNGRLSIKCSKGYKWDFYYRLGRIVWATGGTHPLRRWRRLMTLNCPQIEPEELEAIWKSVSSYVSLDICWDYRLLEILYKKQKIQREQIHAIVEQTIAELLFDVAQKSNFSSISYERNSVIILETPMSFTSVDMSMKHMLDSWKTWSESGLANFSPDLAPALRQPEQLEKMVSPSVYKTFVNLVNGKYTLQDLAVKMKRDLLPVARSLLPYILKGIIELVEVADLPLAVTEDKSDSVNVQPKKKDALLVACVDDSPLVCKMLEEIITSHGLRFVKIQDAVQALPTLIQDKPDLIFLDLIMPVASGYEICAQLRRISAFANTPVVILTGSDGLLDRVRAKVAGSTDYITKPIVADKVMSVVRKYLPVQAASKVKSNLEVKANSTPKLDTARVIYP